MTRGRDYIPLPLPRSLWVTLISLVVGAFASLIYLALAACSSCCERPRECRWTPPPPGPAAKSCGTGKCSGSWECDGPVCPKR